MYAKIFIQNLIIIYFILNISYHKPLLFTIHTITTNERG